MITNVTQSTTVDEKSIFMAYSFSKNYFLAMLESYGTYATCLKRYLINVVELPALDTWFKF